MKFTIQKTILADALSKIQGITSRKTNLAITECVLLKLSSDGITITATDHETGFRGHYEAEVEQEGKIALNSKKLFEIVKEFPSPKININERSENWIEIYDNQVQYHLVGMNPDTFPKLPKLNMDNFITIDSLELKGMVEKAIAIGGAGDEKRAHLNGVYLQYFNKTNGSFLRMVSTDANRMALADVEVEEINGHFPETGVLIPKKSCADVIRSLEKSGKVKISIDENYLIINKEKEKIIVRLLEGQFPSYEEIINRQDQSFDIEIEKNSFMKMLIRMAIMCTESYRAAIFKFDEKLLTINSSNPEIGESKEDIEINNGGNTIELAFNPKYLIDALNAIEEDVIVMNFVNEEKPCIISGKEDKNYLNVIMPMRI